MSVSTTAWPAQNGPRPIRPSKPKSSAVIFIASRWRSRHRGGRACLTGRGRSRPDCLSAHPRRRRERWRAGRRGPVRRAVWGRVWPPPGCAGAGRIADGGRRATGCTVLAEIVYAAAANAEPDRVDEDRGRSLGLAEVTFEDRYIERE